MRYFYTILFYLAMPFVLMRLFWRGRHSLDCRKRWRERFGYTPFQLNQSIWVHVVSVGETIAAIPLIKTLQIDNPGVSVVVTNMTETGAARVKAVFGNQVLQTYIPYDLPGAVSRFLDRIHPKVAVIMETELWPNLFAACNKRAIPIIITNARLSEKSAKGYERVAELTREMLGAVHCLASQGQADAKRFIALGLPKSKLTITGNLKFDLEIPDNLINDGAIVHQELGKKRLIWVAASTHPGEEEVILAAHRLVLAAYPDALLILVPRHPDRFAAVAALCQHEKFRFARRSRAEPCAAETTVYLCDTMGELLLMYSVADVAFVAGSFVSVGGHNMLEPAALHKPILTGPVLFNFAEISEMLLAANGMSIVNNAEELAQQIQKFFADKKLRKTVGENAYKVVEANRGALAKQIELIRSVMKE